MPFSSSSSNGRQLNKADKAAIFPRYKCHGFKLTPYGFAKITADGWDLIYLQRGMEASAEGLVAVNVGVISNLLMKEFGYQKNANRDLDSSKFKPTFGDALHQVRLRRPEKPMEDWFDCSIDSDFQLLQKLVEEDAMAWFSQFGSNIGLRDFWLSIAEQINPRRTAKMLAWLLAELGPQEKISLALTRVRSDRFAGYEDFVERLSTNFPSLNLHQLQ